MNSALVSALIAAIFVFFSAVANLLVLRKTWNAYKQVRSLDSSWRNVVNAAVKWRKTFGGARGHGENIRALMLAVDAMIEREEELKK